MKNSENLISIRRNFCWLTIILTLLVAYSCFGDDSGIKLETGGIQIILPQGWDRLEQPTNIFVQQRARNSERGIAVSAGSFRIGLSLDQYVTIGVAGFESSPEQQFEKISKLTGIPTSEIEKTVQSQVGHQMLEQIERAHQSANYELLNVKKIQISGVPAFDVQSKITSRESGRIIYSRQLTLTGALPSEIVNISFASSSDDIFQDHSLVDAIQKQL